MRITWAPCLSFVVVLFEHFAVASINGEEVACSLVRLVTVEEGARVALALTSENAEAAVDDLNWRNPGLDITSFGVDADDEDEGDFIVNDFDISVHWEIIVENKRQYF